MKRNNVKLYDKMNKVISSCETLKQLRIAEEFCRMGVEECEYTSIFEEMAVRDEFNELIFDKQCEIHTKIKQGETKWVKYL